MFPENSGRGFESRRTAKFRVGAWRLKPLHLAPETDRINSAHETATPALRVGAAAENLAKPYCRRGCAFGSTGTISKT